MKNDSIAILVRTSTHYDWAWKKKYTSMTISAFDTVKEAQQVMYQQRKEDYGTPYSRETDFQEAARQENDPAF